jgi:ABC-type tungstate transport system substrate-binding protein
MALRLARQTRLKAEIPGQRDAVIGNVAAQHDEARRVDLLVHFSKYRLNCDQAAHFVKRVAEIGCACVQGGCVMFVV